jgi:nucleotide sugar dehydrogenase
VIEAAATKPYGYMPFYPGAGVGGHCIPCDPHYLLWSLRARGVGAPLVERAMRSIDERPYEIVDHAARMLGGLEGARVMVAGAAYKPGVRDVREAPAVEILDGLAERGAEVAFHDVLVPRLGELASVEAPDGADYDLVVVCTLHPQADHGWIAGAPRVLDCTHRAPVAASERLAA